MVYFFLVIISIACIVLWGFAIKNDFYTGILEVLYPVVGAVLFSLYLGFKIVYVDSPKPKLNPFSVVFLIDTENGRFDALSIHDTLYLDDGIDFSRGLFNLMSLQSNPQILKLKFSDRLKHKVDDNNIGPLLALNDVLELSIFDWLTKQKIYGLTEQRILLPSFHGSIRSNLVTDTIVKFEKIVSIRDKEKNNSLMAFYTGKLELPLKSRVSRISLDGLARQIRIDTPTSTIAVSFSPTIRRPLTPQYNDFDKKVKEMFSPASSDKNVESVTYTVHFELSQKGFSRFSKIARIEAAWFEDLTIAFKRDYSWEVARERLL